MLSHSKHGLLEMSSSHAPQAVGAGVVGAGVGAKVGAKVGGAGMPITLNSGISR